DSRQSQAWVRTGRIEARGRLPLLFPRPHPCAGAGIPIDAQPADRAYDKEAVMDFGIISLSNVESYKEAALAESKGFTHAWFGDSQMVWADVYQCMALSPSKTTTIKLGTNVTNPSSRIAPVTAGNFATLHILAPGRVI